MQISHLTPEDRAALIQPMRTAADAWLAVAQHIEDGDTEIEAALLNVASISDSTDIILSCLAAVLFMPVPKTEQTDELADLGRPRA